MIKEKRGGADLSFWLFLCLSIFLSLPFQEADEKEYLWKLQSYRAKLFQSRLGQCRGKFQVSQTSSFGALL